MPVRESIMEEIEQPERPRRFKKEWKPRKEGQDQLRGVKAGRNLMAPLPWDRNTTEIMVDGMSFIRYMWKYYERERPDLGVRHDAHSLWPARVMYALQALSGIYGLDRPPSPWMPLIAVYDIPDPQHKYGGMKVKKWKFLSKQGPRNVKGVTLGFAQTYVDQSARERYCSDLEQLWMLELLTRDFDRRQVLVTNSHPLQRRAREYATVRSVQWLLEEIRNASKRGAKIVEDLEDGTLNVEDEIRRCPVAIRRAFER